MALQEARRLYPSNPIGVISLFIFFIEVLATASLKFLIDGQSPYVLAMVVFVIALPSIIAVVFFTILCIKRQILYSPGDFQNDESFLELLNQVKRLETRQQASQVDPATSDTNTVQPLIKQLVEQNEYDAAVHLATAFLKVRRYETSRDLFHNLRESIPPHQSAYREASQGLAQSLNGLAKYTDAASILENIAIQHPLGLLSSLELAYAYFKLDDSHHAQSLVDKATTINKPTDYLPLIEKRYPELSQYLKRDNFVS